MTRRRFRNAEGADQGAAAVEFALLVPLILTLLLGVIDFGRAYNIQETLTQAAREGVRGLALQLQGYSVTTTTTNAAVGVTPTSITYGSQSSSGTLTTNGTCATAGAQNVWVNVTKQYTFIPFLGLGNATITGKAYMRCGG